MIEGNVENRISRFSKRVAVSLKAPLIETFMYSFALDYMFMYMSDRCCKDVSAVFNFAI